MGKMIKLMMLLCGLLLFGNVLETNAASVVDMDDTEEMNYRLVQGDEDDDGDEETTSVTIYLKQLNDSILKTEVIGDLEAGDEFIYEPENNLLIHDVGSFGFCASYEKNVLSIDSLWECKIKCVS